MRSLRTTDAIVAFALLRMRSPFRIIVFVAAVILQHALQLSAVVTVVVTHDIDY